MRAIWVDIEGDTFYSTAYFDREPTDDDHDDLSDIEWQLIDDFPFIKHSETERYFSDAPVYKLKGRGELIFMRREEAETV